MLLFPSFFSFFFFNDTATTEIYTLSLHDALPISPAEPDRGSSDHRPLPRFRGAEGGWNLRRRSEEHTSELQSHSDLVCRLLLEKKKKKNIHEQIARKYRRGTENEHIYSVRTHDRE